MDWTEWAQWFSYGRFEKSGLLSRTRVVWIFDKDRIRHEVEANLHRFRYCPHLRKGLIDSALEALPERVEVSDKGAWKFNRTFEETPGSILVTEIDRSFGGEGYKIEYFADGVRPRSLDALADTLRTAFADAGIKDVSASVILS